MIIICVFGFVYYRRCYNKGIAEKSNPEIDLAEVGAGQAAASDTEEAAFPIQNSAKFRNYLMVQ